MGYNWSDAVLCKDMSWTSALCPGCVPLICLSLRIHYSIPHTLQQRPEKTQKESILLYKVYERGQSNQTQCRDLLSRDPGSCWVVGLVHQLALTYPLRGHAEGGTKGPTDLMRKGKIVKLYRQKMKRAVAEGFFEVVR